MPIREPDRLYQQFLYEKSTLMERGIVNNLTYEDWLEIKGGK